ncbi:hypothetical protein BC940DRAFT_36069 [Gongronella butleri]|nr:hypothetical protein BC940DRAFT_36069 [Gongronella butleri]
MANRAKSRGMDLIYWILTAVLTGKKANHGERKEEKAPLAYFNSFLGFAFALWALIWTIKFVRDVFLIPSKMFRSYRDHVDQRNDKVQLKSRESVTKAVDRPPSGSASSGGTPSSSSSSSGGVSAASSAFNSRQPSSTSSVVPAAASVMPPQLLRTTSTAVPRKNTARRPSSNRT